MPGTGQVGGKSLRQRKRELEEYTQRALRERAAKIAAKKAMAKDFQDPALDAAQHPASDQRIAPPASKRPTINRENYFMIHLTCHS
jgi:hypothetical protein